MQKRSSKTLKHNTEIKFGSFILDIWKHGLQRLKKVQNTHVWLAKKRFRIQIYQLLIPLYNIHILRIEDWVKHMWIKRIYVNNTATQHCDYFVKFSLKFSVTMGIRKQQKHWVLQQSSKLWSLPFRSIFDSFSCILKISRTLKYTMNISLVGTVS